jgi:hypothetical protein
MEADIIIALTIEQLRRIAQHHANNSTYITNTESPFTFEDLDESNSSYLREYDVYPFEILVALHRGRKGIYRYYADSIIFTATME